MFTWDEIAEAVKAANGKRRQRVIKDLARVRARFEEYSADPSTKTIRVYPADAFVANAYKYRAETTFVEFQRGEDGEWTFITGTRDAHRPGGDASHVTVNGRAVAY